MNNYKDIKYEIFLMFHILSGMTMHINSFCWI